MTNGAVRDGKAEGSCTADDVAICSVLGVKVTSLLSKAERKETTVDVRCKRDSGRRVFSVFLCDAETKAARTQLTINAPDGVIPESIYTGAAVWMEDGANDNVTIHAAPPAAPMTPMVPMRRPPPEAIHPERELDAAEDGPPPATASARYAEQRSDMRKRNRRSR